MTSSSEASSHCPLGVGEITAEMAQAAQQLLTTLTAEQRQQITVDFDDAERFNWHYVPRDRRGLPLKAMTPEQRFLAHALLITGLSQRGYGKALSIMSLEAVLAEIEQGHGPVRDPLLFYFTVFGEPGPDKPWGWRVEGHHLSLNFTSTDHELAATPSFFGSNPAEVRDGPRAGTRILHREEDLGRQLVQSLNEEQRTIAILPVAAPDDILNTPGQRDFTRAQGLSQAQMDASQSALLLQLIHEYLWRHRAEIANTEWQRIEADGLAQIHFAWAGSPEVGQPYYYRVQGRSFVLELDNTQNKGNHVHSVWRDLENDFGADLLSEHYNTAHRHL